jgi:PAS domain-containing protein
VAVAVEQAPHIVLDEDYRIVEVSPAAEAGFGHLRGQNVLESFPDSRPLFLPYYERARRTGAVLEFAQYYDGYVLHLTVVPSGQTLTVFWDTPYMLDVLTLDGLRASLQSMLETLRASEDATRRESVRRSLSVVGSEG